MCGERSDSFVAEGLEVPEGTIHHWARGTHTSRYAEIQEELQNEVARRMGARAFEIADKSMDATELAVDKAQAALEENQIEPRDLAPTARNEAGRGNRSRWVGHSLAEGN
jgi:hypothetical protein